VGAGLFSFGGGHVGSIARVLLWGNPAFCRVLPLSAGLSVLRKMT
jgi:hypothetical protein